MKRANIVAERAEQISFKLQTEQPAALSAVRNCLPHSDPDKVVASSNPHSFPFFSSPLRYTQCKLEVVWKKGTVH